MYHALEDEKHPAGSKDKGEQHYVVTVDNFKKQTEYLHKYGFRTFLIHELFDLQAWPEKGIVITFDDGHDSNYNLALPILQQFGFKAEFFITTGWTGTKHYLTREQIIGLHAAGMTIGSHGVSHLFMNDLSNEKVFNELSTSKQMLSEIIGEPIQDFAAPGGRMGQTTIEIAKSCGYRFLYSSIPGPFLRTKAKEGVIPRFAIYNGTQLNDFIRIVQLDTCYLKLQKSKAACLNLLKKIMGNAIYERVRSKII